MCRRTRRASGSGISRTAQYIVITFMRRWQVLARLSIWSSRLEMLPMRKPKTMAPTISVKMAKMRSLSLKA